MMTKRFTAVLTAGLAVAALAGCSQSASQLLTTGSLTGGAKPATGTATPAAVVVKPEDRAINVAATSARARKCGYFFDPARMRADYLASETQAGLAPDGLVRLTKVYDYTANKVTTVIATRDGYCTDERLASIKKNLTRYLAGNYAPPERKKVAAGGLFDFVSDEPPKKEKLNPDWVNSPSREPMTKPVEEE